MAEPGPTLRAHCLPYNLRRSPLAASNQGAQPERNLATRALMLRGTRTYVNVIQLAPSIAGNDEASRTEGDSLHEEDGRVAQMK